jgi:AraC family transcriptional regulator, transcriptional activator of pobA
MNEIFTIGMVNVEEANKIASSPNEPHIHNYEELLVGQEGALEHFIDFKAASLKAPFISFITKGKVHHVKPLVYEGKCSIWVMRFSTEFIPETSFRLYSYYHDHANLEMKNDDSFIRMGTLCGMMNDEMQKSDPNLPVVRDLLKALFTMIEAENNNNSDPGDTLPGAQNTTFRNFLKILEENFRRPEGIDFYADKLFMSSRNLNIICQNILHHTATEIIEIRKLTEAKNLLVNTDKSISEIGFDLGFNEKAYFTNVFKKRSGQTPSEFREEMRNLIS